jgi:hypothetical protein
VAADPDPDADADADPDADARKDGRSVKLNCFKAFIS